MNDKLNLSVNLINAVLAYLGTKPYQEVFQMIEALQKEAKEQPEKTEQPMYALVPVWFFNAGNNIGSTGQAHTVYRAA